VQSAGRASCQNAKWGTYRDVVCPICLFCVLAVVAPLNSFGWECPQCGYVDVAFQWLDSPGK
jgi:hypothetical protein